MARTRAVTPPIEVASRPGLRLGMTPRAFLRRYWQKHPLLIRGAFADVPAPLAPDDLFAVAAEPEALARLVRTRGRRYALRTGPFAAAELARLPARDWTLLVQDCDKWFDGARDLLRHVAFIPSWRVDDVMVSYAADGGSVGAHVDQYDVFLVQAMGRRRWCVDTRAQAPRDFLPNQPLKLLRRFAPSHEWVLEPGDALYLPPGVPHHGVADGACLTCSIGMRAPSAQELLMAFAAAQPADESRRYADPDLGPGDDPGVLDDASLHRARALLRRLVDQPGDPDWLARFLTTYRSTHAPAPPRRKHDAATLRSRIARGARFELSPWARALYRRERESCTLFVAGDAYPCSLVLARRLAGREAVTSLAARRLAASDWATLAALANDGHAGLAR